MKKLALLVGCLSFLACSSDGENAGTGGAGQGGDRMGGMGGMGGDGHGGRTGSAGHPGSGGQVGGSTGTAGNASGGGQAGGSPGGRSAGTGAAGNSGGGGQAGSSAGGGHDGSGGQAGTAGQGGGGAGGNGGRGGAGGGKAGQGGTGGTGPSCKELQTAYAKALSNARMCNLAVSVPSCTHLVPSALSCGCSVWVNDTTELDRIAAQWQAAGCTPGVVCAAIACLSPGTHAVCVPIDSGDVCMGTDGPT